MAKHFCYEIPEKSKLPENGSDYNQKDFINRKNNHDSQGPIEPRRKVVFGDAKPFH